MLQIGNEVKYLYAFTDIFGGTDLVTGISEIHLTELSDDVVGTSGQEVVYTHEGDDFIETHGGSDFIHAGDGQDTIIFYGERRFMVVLVVMFLFFPQTIKIVLKLK